MKMICIICPRGCRLDINEENGFKVSGNACPRGAEYAETETKNPKRTVTSTVEVMGGTLARCPVKTRVPIPKPLIAGAMRMLARAQVHAPVQAGQEIAGDIPGTDIRFIATRSVPSK